MILLLSTVRYCVIHYLILMSNDYIKQAYFGGISNDQVYTVGAFFTIWEMIAVGLFLKWKFAKIMLLCWVLPFLVIIGLVGSYMLITQRENQMERLAAQAGLNTRTCAERLNGAIADSRQATYDGTLFEQYRQYRRQGSSGERIFSNGVQNYLNAQYSHKKNNIFTVLMLKEDMLKIHQNLMNIIL